MQRAAQLPASGEGAARPACRSAAVSAERGVPVPPLLPAGDRPPPLLRAGLGGGLGDSAVLVRTDASPCCTSALESADRETGGEAAAAATAGGGASAGGLGGPAIPGSAGLGSSGMPQRSMQGVLVAAPGEPAPLGWELALGARFLPLRRLRRSHLLAEPWI